MNGSADARPTASGDVHVDRREPATVVPSCDRHRASTIVNEAGAAATDDADRCRTAARRCWNVANGELDDAQCPTYVYANIAKARARADQSGASTRGSTPAAGSTSTSPARATRSRPATTSTSIAASASARTPARVADVVDHEFGHVLHNHSVIAGVGVVTSIELVRGPRRLQRGEHQRGLRHRPRPRLHRRADARHRSGRHRARVPAGPRRATRTSPARS